MLIFKALKRDIEFRKKCMITLGILILIRIFCSIPTLGVNAEYFKTILQENTSLGFLNTLTGNGLSSLSVMALSITPYITASIMVQLLGICFPKIHEMQYSSMKDDRDKIEKATIILGFFLAFTEAITMSAVFGKQGLLIKYTWYWVLIVALIWTAGASIASVLGKYITDNYIGNGISLILAMNIFSSYLSDSKSIYITLIEGNSDTGKILFGLGIFLFFLLLFAFQFVNLVCRHEGGVLHPDGLVPAAVLLEQLDDQQLVVRYGELRDGIHRTHVAFPLRHQHLVVAAHRVDHPFLNGGALRHFLVHDLEPDKVRLESYVRPVPRFRVEIEQPVVRVDGFQEELHPEAFAAQVPDLPPVLFVDALHDQLHQERAFACQLPEMDVHAGMRKVRRVLVL